MLNTCEEIWSAILKSIEKDISPRAYETWFVHTKPAAYEGNTVVVETPNAYFRDWLIDHYREVVEEAARKAVGRELGVRFVVAQAPAPVQKEAGQIKPPGPAAAERPRRKKTDSAAVMSSALNPRFIFDNFVVGSGNRFAHAAALAVAKSPARAYNPLFIYGGVGMGKTHLLQAIGHLIKAGGHEAKVIYISSERFTNQLISAIQNRTTFDFRQMYRNVDALLIDDIHFIAGKESTQEEFFHTFNVLYDAHKQIVLSSDRPPKDIPRLEQRIISRFEWGLVTDIQPPDFETRIAILRKKAEKETVEVPDDVTSFIAEKIKTNIRELEGALIRVVAYASLTGQKITLPLAQDVLKDMIREEKRITIEMVQRAVANMFEIGISDLRGKKRSRVVAFPRQVAMFLTRQLTNLSLPQIGEYFGGRDHTTVLHACNKIARDSAERAETKQLIGRLSVKIKED